MTLIELTVVILVLISLIAVLFIGARAWKRGSDRSAAVITIRNSQMGLRAHNRIEGIDDAGTFLNLPQQVFGQNKYVFNGAQKADGELPSHPANGQTFDFVAGNGDIIPPLGQLYICTGGISSLNDFTYNPTPNVYRQW